jgi:ATP-dependent DNA helicase RecG
MNRLLQGDVGSGKTVVALLAMLVAAESGGQAVLMAPTEILAEQHFRNWQERLAAVGVEAALLTGSTRAARRREILAGLADGSISLVFGTHALIEGEVRFERLGLVVVDEQHRFGVMQRASLLGKGHNPDFLVMTATPIPRTLAMTLYGDLEVSVLAEKPPGRKAVDTRLIPEARRREVYDAIGRRLDTGEQAFVVCPIIEESEKLDLASAITVFEQTRAALPGRRVGLVHGRLKADERNRLMAEFRAGALDIVVATSVIEVGVDVPNATLMIIEHPERFGLAQLHQLRGRIGRSPRQSWCLLIVPDAAAEAAERLRFFALTADGFELAEKDMDLRGPGQLLGTRQHGLPDLRAADLVRDRETLKLARRDAFRMIELDPELNGAHNEPIRRAIEDKFKDRAGLLRVG